MKRVDAQFNRLERIQGEVNKTVEAISQAITGHIKEDYFLSYDRGDGWLIVCGESAKQTKINFMGVTLSEILDMSPGKAKSLIDENSFN